MKRLARRFEASLRFADGETMGEITLEPLPALPERPGAGGFGPPRTRLFRTRSPVRP